MSRRARRAIWLPVAVIFALVAFYGVNRFRYRFVRSDDDLLRLLPDTNGTVFFAKVDQIRAAGYLKLVEGTKPNQEKDYLAFVRETGFDYAKDLSAVAGMAADEQIWLALRGRFDWANLRQYAGAHGGKCDRDVCRVPGSTAGRIISFRAIQPDVLALAISGDRSGAERIRAGQNSLAMASNAPLWIRPSATLLANPAVLPMALRIFAISLQSAQSVVLALEPSETNGAAFAVSIDAAFTNQAAADTARDQLDRSTAMLKLEFERDHRKPDPGDLAWLLTAGSFQVAGRRVIGSWPVRRELLGTLQ